MLLDGETPVILLEDFAAEPLVFQNSLNVGSVQRAMSGVLAHAQFYFVDACQSPTRLRIYQGEGRLLDDPRALDRRDSAPIYYGAAPGQEAYAQTEYGSIFSQALISCLDSRGADFVRGQWQVSALSLHERLLQAIEEAARTIEVVQSARVGGMIGHGTLHVLTRPPMVPIRFLLQPKQVVGSVHGALLNSRMMPLLDPITFEPNPFEDERPTGIYGLRLQAVGLSGDRREMCEFWAAEVPYGIDSVVWVDE
jgi:hypothetical protein